MFILQGFEPAGLPAGYWRENEQRLTAVPVKRSLRRNKSARREAHGTGEKWGEEGVAGLVELRGIEPLTSAVRLQRSPI